MKTYETFIFESYELDATTKEISLRYSFDGEISFVETVKLPENLQTTHPDLDKALFALHLAGGISYYKAACPPKIEIRSGGLTEGQATFWNTYYTKGLGEFFYQNNIDFRGLISFPATEPSKPLPEELIPSFTSPKALVAFGGGKDSVVSVELLKKIGAEITLFRVGEHPLVTTLAKTAERPVLTVGRQLSQNLFELNQEGALNGHIPITGYISFLSVVVALLGGYQSVVFSNERSANYGNVLFHGLEINHQWSKSLEAENLVKSYLQYYVTSEVAYVNMLRPLSELRIGQIFSKYPQYLSGVTSCNVNWKISGESPEHKWCGHCPKCAFVFAILAAFEEPNRLIEAFGKNLFSEEKLVPLYRQLLGIEGFKPFECVGTPEETAAALYLASQKVEYKDTVIIKLLEDTQLKTLGDLEALAEEVLQVEGVSPLLAKAGII